MSNDAVNWARTLKIPPGPKFVLMVLADRADEHDRAWPTITSLAADTSFPERTIYRHLKTLTSMGIVSVNSSPGKLSVYQIIRTEPLTQCHPCHDVTPDTVSPLTQCHPCHSVSGPLTQCQWTPDTVSAQRARLYINPKETPKKPSTLSASASPDAVNAAPSRTREREQAVYVTKRKRKLTGKRLESFNAFWAAFAYPKGKAEAADAWLDIPQLTNALVEQIVTAAGMEAAARPQLVADGRTPKWAQGWLSGRRWEDGPGPGPPREKSLDEILAEKGILQ